MARMHLLLEEQLAMVLKHVLSQREIVWATDVEPHAVVLEATDVRRSRAHLQKQ